MDENPYEAPNEVSEEPFDWFRHFNLVVGIMSAIFSIGVLAIATLATLRGQ
jgi:hypothetical protein